MTIVFESTCSTVKIWLTVVSSSNQLGAHLRADGLRGAIYTVHTRKTIPSSFESLDELLANMLFMT